MPRDREDPDELNFGEVPSIEDMDEIAETYRRRELEEDLTDSDFAADAADWDGYRQQWGRR